MSRALAECSAGTLALLNCCFSKAVPEDLQLVVAGLSAPVARAAEVFEMLSYLLHCFSVALVGSSALPQGLQHVLL